MLKYFFSILFFFLLVVKLPGQAISINDEEKTIGYLRDDTAKINKLNKYSEKIQFTYPEKAISIIEKTIMLANKVNYPLGLSVAYSLRAGLLYYEMKLDSCKLLLDKAYSLVNNKKDKASKNQIANIINRYAAIYQRRQNYDSAVELYLNAANIYKETGDEQKIINSYYNLSGIYKYLGDTAKTFFYARETNKLAEITNDTVFLIRGIIALGEAYNFIKNYDSLLLVSKKGLSLASRQQMTFALGIFNNFMGLYYTNKVRQFDSAIMYYNVALQVFENINIPFDKAVVLQNIGNAYLKKKDYINAIKFSKQATELSKNLKFDQVQNLSLMDLVQAEEKMGNIPESFKYLKEYVEVNDFIQIRNNQKKVYDLEAKYLAQKKEVIMLAQEKIIKQKNQLNYLLASGLSLLLIIVALLYFNYQNKQKLQLQKITELETQQQLTATEAVLKGEEQERTRLAKDLHDGLGGMLSGIKFSFNTMKGNLTMTPDNAQSFERSMDMLDSSIKEMRRVAHNMMPEALVKFGLDTALKDFCNEIQQSGALYISYQSIGLENLKITQTIEITVYRIVQELVNNIMKHAAAKNAIVQVTKTNDRLSVTVEDDGGGFDTGILNKVKGIGWSSIQNRVEFLKGKLDVDSQSEKGTSVHIEINV
ncbi:MAG: sensor histidine kinase [Ferruginibacter sp.]|nr:sensor histidine kinase [Ferruginibacter sp.]